MSTVLRRLLGFDRDTVITGWELESSGDRPILTVRVRARQRRRGGCGRCGVSASFYDQGGGDRRWRHLDVGYATCVLVGSARRVDCPVHGPTVARVPWARHDSAFTRAFEDLVCWEAVASSKNTAAVRYQISWRAVNGICVRVATQALDRIDLLEGLIAVAIDEVKYKKGQKYLTIVCDHVTGRVVWAAEGRSKDTVNRFFDALGDQRAETLELVSADGAEWIRTVVAARAPQATICLDTFHLVSWATTALDEVRRGEWNRLRGRGAASKAKTTKGLRWLLIRNWENLTPSAKATLRELEKSNRRLFRAWQLKEELRDIMGMTPVAADLALDEWIHHASRSRLAPFVRLARTIRHYRESILATVEWKLTNGIAESVNASIGRLRANARGFHKPESFIAMIHLDRSGLTPPLPWTHA
ncbi:MAG TPA: ISL3 family transposase [Acidimicrobiia bacterium]